MQQGSGQNATDQTASFFWYIVLLTVAVILVWCFGKKFLVPPLFYIRSVELRLLEWVLVAWNHVAGFMHLPLANLNLFADAQHIIQIASPKEVTIDQVNKLNTQLGDYYRYPFIGIILVLAYLSSFKHRSAKFTNTYSMKSLKKSEAVNWPHITPVLGLNLLKHKLDEGPWAMAKTPLDFSRQHDILALAEKNDKKVWTIKKGAAERLFVLQMGPLWDGVEKLPMHIKALLVIILLHLDRNKKESDKLLNQLSLSSTSSAMNFAGTAEYLVTLKNHKALKWALKRHAYVYTVMATLLEMSRIEGVLATAEFLWLKPLDRRLWYVLNSVGRNTPIVEAAGVYAHWLAEKKLKRALRTPLVNEAVIALDAAVGNMLYTHQEDQWHRYSDDEKVLDKRV